MNGDIWPYGFAANSTVIEAMIRWSQNDGLLARNLVAASNDGPTILGGFKKRVEGIAWTLTDSNKEKLQRMLRNFYAPDVTSTQVPSLRFSVPQKNREPDQ